jgi:Protein of unknown function (DUF1573)
MLRWISLAVVVVVLVGSATFVSSNATIKEPTAHPVVTRPEGPSAKVEVPEPLVYEFGAMPQLSTGTHSWEFKNVGDADLELWFESSTCSCTVAKLKSEDGEEKKKLVVKPKSATPIDLEWQTKLFHDEYSKGAKIGTNDPARPTVEIGVTGKVHPPVIVVPNEMLSFGSVGNEEAHVGKVAVFSIDRPETKITKLTTSRPDFFVATPEPLTPDECKQLKAKAGYEANVEMKQGMPLGRFHEELVIETDHPLKPEIKMTITGNITGPITAIPERVRISNVSSSQGATHHMTLLVRGGRATKFEVAYYPENMSEKINVTITPDDTQSQKGRYKMTVTVPPGTPAGPVDGDIILKTDHPNVSEMKIPVSILISNSGAS